ncbi:MAG TPA: hypothetical protein VN837_08865 [Chloroflexota bacterium]|nr:hypothetical protein [Chloroflexota bacterium]
MTIGGQRTHSPRPRTKIEAVYQDAHHCGWAAGSRKPHGNKRNPAVLLAAFTVARYCLRFGLA